MIELPHILAPEQVIQHYTWWERAETGERKIQRLNKFRYLSSIFGLTEGATSSPKQAKSCSKEKDLIPSRIYSLRSPDVPHGRSCGR